MRKTSIFGDDIDFFDMTKKRKNNLSAIIRENKFNNYSPNGITSYLTFRHPIGDLTMFSGCFKVPFGAQRIENKNHTYWYPKFTQGKDDIEEAISKVEGTLLNSISNLTKNSRNVAVTLSGGVDSSLIVAMIRKLYPKRQINTYCVGFYGDDEFEYASKVASDNKTIHKEILLHKEDFIGPRSILGDLIKFKAAPLHPNELPLAIAQKIAKNEGMDLVLCGEGSDDIFGGYGQNLRMYLNYDHKESFFRYFLDKYRYFSIFDREIINPKYLVDDFELLMKCIKFSEIDCDIRNWALYFTQKIHTPGLITRGANALRYNGFPLGFPFIDDDLVNYANCLPFEYKIAWKSDHDFKMARNKDFREVSEKYDIPKYILKKVAEKYLNHEIIYRQKKGFPVPFDKWFADLTTWDFDKEMFVSNDISKYNGWKKFMLINLDAFVKIFNKFKR